MNNQEAMDRALIPIFNNEMLQTEAKVLNITKAKEVLNLATEEAERIIKVAESTAKNLNKQAALDGFAFGQELAAKELITSKLIKNALIESSAECLHNIIFQVLTHLFIEFPEARIEFIKKQIKSHLDQVIFSDLITIFLNPNDLLQIKNDPYFCNSERTLVRQIKFVALAELPESIVKIKTEACAIENSPTIYLDNMIQILKNSALIENAIDNLQEKLRNACDRKQ